MLNRSHKRNHSSGTTCNFICKGNHKVFFWGRIISIFAMVFPIIWSAFVEKNNTLTENILTGLGGFISTLFFYGWKVWDSKKTRTLILKQIKKRSNNEMVIISLQERILLGPLIKYFIEQPGQIANATNNTVDLRLYKLSKKIKRKLEKI